MILWSHQLAMPSHLNVLLLIQHTLLLEAQARGQAFANGLHCLPTPEGNCLDLPSHGCESCLTWYQVALNHAATMVNPPIHPFQDWGLLIIGLTTFLIFEGQASMDTFLTLAPVLLASSKFCVLQTHWRDRELGTWWGLGKVLSGAKPI